MDYQLNLQAVVRKGETIDNDVDRCIYYSNAISFINMLEETVRFTPANTEDQNIIIEELNNYIVEGLKYSKEQLREAINTTINHKAFLVENKLREKTVLNPNTNTIPKRTFQWKVKN